MIKYSVIIPQRNNVAGVQRLVGSLPRRTDLEILISDDHSDQQVWDQLTASFGQMAGVQVFHSQGRGAGAARNQALARAQGEWLVFADSDDQFTTDALTILDQECQSKAEVIYFYPLTSQMAVNDYRVNYQRKFQQYFQAPTLKNEWNLRLNFDVPWSKAVRRSLVVQHQFQFDQTRKQNDTLFAQKIGINAEQVKIVDRSIYLVIDTKGSLSHTTNRQIFNDIVGVRIRSYQLKVRSLPRPKLLEWDPDFLQVPLRTVLYAYRDFRSLRYSAVVYRRFRKTGIPVFSRQAVGRLVHEVVRSKM